MTADETRTQIAGQLLAWYEAMGVDAAVEDSAIDWLARGARLCRFWSANSCT